MLALKNIKGRGDGMFYRWWIRKNEVAMKKCAVICAITEDVNLSWEGVAFPILVPVRWGTDPKKKADTD